MCENQHSLFPIPNYIFIGDSRSTRAGGFGIYLHRRIAVSEVRAFSLAGAESVSLSLAGAGGKSFHLTSVYRSPSSDVGMFLNDLNLSLATFRDLRPHIITGDFNINVLKPESADYLD